MNRIYACPVADVPEGEALRIDTSPVIALFNVGGEFYAINDRCSHGNASMSEGYLEDDAYSAAIFLIPICISFDTAEKRRYATYLILNRRFSFEF